MTEKKGSDTARPAPKRNRAGNKGRQADPKSHGRPAARKNNPPASKNKAKRAGLGAQSKPAGSVGGSSAEGRKQAPVVVCTKSGHPHCAPGTFDAAALLKSVLAVVEPTLMEGLGSLEEALLTSQGEAGAEAQPNGQSLRGVQRQIAEAVRSAVIEGMRIRERHLAQLVVIDRAAAQTDALVRLQERIGTEIARAGLRRVVDLTDLSLFNLADSVGLPPEEDADRGALELVTPAYVDADTGQVVERGWVRRLPSAESSQPQGKRYGRASHPNKDKKDRRYRSSGRLGDLDGTSASEVDESTHMQQSASLLAQPLSGGDNSRNDAPAERREGASPEKRSDGDADGYVTTESARKSMKLASGEADQQQSGQRKQRQHGKDTEFFRAADAADRVSRHDSRPGSEGDGADLSGQDGPSESAGRESSSRRQAGPGRVAGKATRRDPAARDAPRIASSFIVRRLLGDPADNGQPPRRSS